ncbi:MAG: outer membrane lipoprotein-sorting protein [Candidatus Neomarinimicrobiota bacterium]|nr:MAG: outer membrane lipoprotein-sorting protein [Candidatus Neomarinimicrobiota bacterium]
MKKHHIFIATGIIFLTALQAAPLPDGMDILKRVDENITAENRIMTSRMIVRSRRSKREITAKTWIRGMDQAFTEYLSPAREQGTKMFKEKDRMWIYSPSTDRIIQIAGHMLRQSVMGSDLSYEDMMEDPVLSNQYTAITLSVDTLRERPCWILELTAKTEDIAYYKRKLWVDQERMIALREERFAKGGTLLKETDVFSVFQIEGRWYPKEILYKDVLNQNSEGTRFIIESLELNADIPDWRFTKAALRRS